MTHQEMLEKIVRINISHQGRAKEIERSQRMLWLLVALIALAPEIIMVGRRLLK